MRSSREAPGGLSGLRSRWSDPRRTHTRTRASQHGRGSRPHRSDSDFGRCLASEVVPDRHTLDGFRGRPRPPVPVPRSVPELVPETATGQGHVPRPVTIGTSRHQEPTLSDPTAWVRPLCPSRDRSPKLEVRPSSRLAQARGSLQSERTVARITAAVVATEPDQSSSEVE